MMRTVYPIRNAFTMIEVVISTLLIAGLMLAAMNAVGASVLGRERIVHETRGQLLADDLADHIAALAYLNPETAGLGIDGIFRDEFMTATTWGGFDDVDDFVGWTKSPPELGDGTPVPGFDTAWERSVSVKYVHSETLEEMNGLSGGDGVKRMIVTVTHNGIEVGRAVLLRSWGADDARNGELGAEPVGAESGDAKSQSAGWSW